MKKRKSPESTECSSKLYSPGKIYTEFRVTAQKYRKKMDKIHRHNGCQEFW